MGTRFRLAGWLIGLFFVLAGLSSCRPQMGAGSMPTVRATAVLPLVAEPILPAPTLPVTATPPEPPPVMEQPTVAIPATFTPNPTGLPVTTPTIPPQLTATTVPALLPTVIPVGRQCPNPSPLKPDYARYTLGNSIWPAPDPAVTQTHFWLSKPLPGGGRYLINQTFPYGTDGNGRYLLHNGVDAAEKLGSPVLAVADGTIVVAQQDANVLYGWRCDWYGHLVVLELDDKWLGQPVFVLYGHVLNFNVTAGQRVVRGEQIAEIGIGGAATVPHLHLEVRVGDNEFAATRNPMLWIDPGDTRGVIAGRILNGQGRPWQGVALGLIGGDEAVENRNTWSYMDDPSGRGTVHPDAGWAENFVFADVRPGNYNIYVKLNEIEYRQPVTVVAGQVSTVEIITQPVK